ncbi:MAG: hypothetical protein KKF30_03685 [Proteobacteria bacterium]|nr:hypothetical protein [Pseudomonadota bacterium]MBU4470158.1 hypothetical protein [Pseudomonadota bacterium]
MHPEFSPAYNDLAWRYAEQDKSLQDALGLIETALKIEPENKAYLDTRAEVLYKLHRYDDAIAIEKKLVYLYPEIHLFREQLKKYLFARQQTNDLPK